MSNIFQRVRDITLATLNDHLERSEDPIRVIDSFLLKTRHEIEEAERLYHQYLVHANQMKRQLNQAEELRERREQQALMALKAGEELAAKLALQEKMMHEEKVIHYTELYEKSKQAILELEAQLQALKNEFQSAYDKRQIYIARMQTIHLQQRMNERIGQYGHQQVNGMFRRLEDRVNDMEWETNSIRDVRGTNGGYNGGFERESKLDQELQRLKQKLNTSKE
ncbi:PspA/IM30 family protein [Paenibacillus agilis]|uniref:PspA/IM30 family protein n=1 Tax=Paenibacillus agilis TaxID=3020863 RepID=A0A559IHB8_9BACL|nr:PspA/IM30 family protein [Paenibacillus agilis]TVX87046.1 PspA/IM30 family protein [Paenibacillus agilis]